MNHQLCRLFQAQILNNAVAEMLRTEEMFNVSDGANLCDVQNKVVSLALAGGLDLCEDERATLKMTELEICEYDNKLISKRMAEIFVRRVKGCAM